MRSIRRSTTTGRASCCRCWTTRSPPRAAWRPHRPAGHDLQLRNGHVSGAERVLAAASLTRAKADPGGDGKAPAARPRRARRAHAHRARRRLLRPARRQQLVCCQGLLVGSSRPRRVLYPGPRELGHFLGLSAGRCGNRSPACSTQRSASSPSPSSTFAVTGSNGVWTWRKRSAALPGCQPSASLRSHGGRFASPHRSSRCAGRCWRCVTCGRCRPSSTTRSCCSVIGAEPHTPLEEAVRRALSAEAAEPAEASNSPAPASPCRPAAGSADA